MHFKSVKIKQRIKKCINIEIKRSRKYKRCILLETFNEIIIKCNEGMVERNEKYPDFIKGSCCKTSSHNSSVHKEYFVPVN